MFRLQPLRTEKPDTPYEGDMYLRAENNHLMIYISDKWIDWTVLRENPEQIVFVNKDIQCECGADKCGSPGHSQWCPKYNRQV